MYHVTLKCIISFYFVVYSMFLITMHRYSWKLETTYISRQENKVDGCLWLNMLSITKKESLWRGLSPNFLFTSCTIESVLLYHGGLWFSKQAAKLKTGLSLINSKNLLRNEVYGIIA